MKYRLLLIKRLAEDILMFPLILLGRIIAAFNPLDKEYRVFFFFPFYHTGGAEKVHALVAKATGGKDCIIFFTKKSHNQAFLANFRSTGCEIRDVSRYTDNKWLYFVNIIHRGIISGYINRQKVQPIIFNGQANFGYKISPWIQKRIKQVELIHSISNFSYIRIPFLPFIAKTVMISRQKIQEHLDLYRRFGIPVSFDQKIHYIPNASEFATIEIAQKDFSDFTVFYSGRATTEKRSHLVAAIAEKVYKQNPGIRYVMAGDEFHDLDRQRFAFITFPGNIANEKELAEIYKSSHVLLITSSTEGFPLAVIEGMAYGCAILATPVGDIPAHVTSGENGFLFSTVEDEERLIEEGTKSILQLEKDRALLKKIAENNIAYAGKNFGYERFAEDYQKIMTT